jgi:hypothetical protein
MFLAFVTLFTTAAWAETMQAKVIADEVTYDYESKQVEATGNVKIEYKNVKVESDYALIDQEQDVLLATGKVVVHNNGNVYHGDKFLYYLKTQQGWVSPMDSEITDPDINGPVRLTAAEAFIKGEELRTKHSSLTSCDLEHPHYHFSAKEIEYYPDDLIIMRHVWYFEHRVPIFYFPILYISLKKDNFAVSYGFSDSEGWFVDADYYYYFPEDYSFGKIKTRLTEYGGDYVEVDHSKYTSHTGIFTQEYGFLDKSNMTNSNISMNDTYNNKNNKYTYNDTPYFHDAEYGSPNVDYMVGLDYKENLNPKIVTEQEISSWRHFTQNGDSYLDNRYSLNLTSQTPYPTIALKISDLGEQTYRTIDFRTNWQYNPDNTFTINLNGSWLSQGLLADSNQIPITQDDTLIATKNWGWSNVQITVKNYINTDSTSDDNKLPEIIYTIPDYKAPVVGDVKISTAYTYLEKYTLTDLVSKGERYAWNINKTIKFYQQGQITFDNSSDIWYRDFFITQGVEPKTETEFYAVDSKLNMTDHFTKELSSTISLGYTDTAGFKNSYFTDYSDDNVDPGAFLQNTWNWQSASFTATASTSYNFQTQIATPLSINTTWIPDPVSKKETFQFDTVYNWYLGLGQTDLHINYNPKKDWLLRLGVGYDFQNPDHPWGSRSLFTQIQDRLSTNWEYSINAQYEDLYNEFTQAQIGLIYDWHCRKVLFSFDILQQEFWVQISINAFPSANLRLDSKNTVENLINDVNSQLQ